MKKIYSLLAVILCSILLTTGCGAGSTKELHCTKDYSSTIGSNITMIQAVDATFKSDKVQDLKISLDFELPESLASSAETYLNSIKTQYEKTYAKYDGVEVTLDKTSDLKFSIIISMDYKNISDSDKTAMGFSGSETYAANKKSFENEGYTCK